MTKSILQIPVYSTKLIIIQQKSLNDLVKKHKLSSDFKKADAITIRDSKKNQYIVAFKKKVDPGLIAHEAKHAVNMMFEDRGIKLDPDNDENEVRFLEWIVNTVHKKIKLSK